MTDLHIPAPNPKQRLFFADKHRYIAFGGARGGGKSWAVRVKALLMALRYAGIKVAIVRRSYQELYNNHIKPMRALIPQTIAAYNDSRKEFRFACGSTLQYLYCDSERDMMRYQGAEFDVVFLDEATHFDEVVFRMFAACVRGVNGYPKRIYLTCNPGGKGHGWVKRLFVDKVYQAGENPDEYSFIQSLVQDNAALMASQPEYMQHLEALPPKLRQAWLYGDWDVFEGQFFEDFVVSSNPERRNTHVIAPFNPPRSWKRFRSFDFGYARPFSCGWWAIDHDGTLYRIAELYGCTETPNEGVKWSPDQIFAEIARVEREHPYLSGQSVEGVADPSIWDASRGVSVADMAAKQGIYFEPGDNARLPGWMQVHYRLRFDADGYPKMYVFDTCKAFIRTIPLLCYDEHVPEDVDTDGEDHVADEVRYMCMRNPINPPLVAPTPPKPYDPLDIKPLEQHNEYIFYQL